MWSLFSPTVTLLTELGLIVSVTRKAAAGAKRIFDILDHVSSVPEPAKPVPLPALQGAPTLRDVGFRYGSRGVIRGLGAQTLLIADSHGVHYLVPDLLALDRHSRRLLDRFL